MMKTYCTKIFSTNIFHCDCTFLRTYLKSFHQVKLLFIHKYLMVKYLIDFNQCHYGNHIENTMSLKLEIEVIIKLISL